MHDETSNTWLRSIQDAGADSDCWNHLVKSYGPLVYDILTRNGLQEASADDVAQNVMVIAARKLPEFQRKRSGSFRSWLRKITLNCLRDHLKSSQYRDRASGDNSIHKLIQGMEDAKSDFTRKWNQEHARHVVDEILKGLAPEFSEKSIEIFRRLAIQEEAVEQVAQELETTTNACFIARSRVLKRVKAVLIELFRHNEGLYELMP